MLKKKVVAFIQARMGSTRLPGKIMMDINGRPMLWHVFFRLKRARLLDDVVVVTTTGSGDDVVEVFCGMNQMQCFRGNEHDVLDRYYQAAKVFHADVLVRITADCPLIDPATTDQVVDALLRNKDGFCGAANIVHRTYPRGLDVEAFSFVAIEKAWKMTAQPYEREHVTIYFYEHPEFFKVCSVEQARDLSWMRWTVDQMDDLHFIKEVYRLMQAQGKEFFDCSDVVALLKQYPDLQKLNASVMQKTIH